MEWVNQYVGVPWLEKGRTLEEGCDCYGLVRLVLAKHFDIHLDAHDQFYESIKQDRESISSTIQRELGFSWHKLTPEEPVQAGDLVLLRIGNLPLHTGVMVNQYEMLNVRQGCQAVVEALDCFIWRRRLVGVYRHG